MNTAATYGGLNPKSRIKFFSDNAAEPVEMTAFKEEFKQLFFDEILPACREQDERKKREAIEQEKAQLASE